MQTPQEIAKENASLRQENAFLKQELSQLKKLIFGSKKERFISSDSAQQSLFETESLEQETEEEDIHYKRQKPTKSFNAKRLLLPAHLPREEEVLEPVGVDVENCQKIGEKISEVLEYTPGKLYVAKTVRPVYKQPDQQIVVADLPTQIIPKGNAGASLLAYLLVSKFIDHLPFYRQAQMFKRDGIKIPESTITGWFKKACDLLSPLYEHMCEQIRGSDYVQADETPLPVLTSQKPGSTHKGYQWVFLLPKSKLVIFQYHPSRTKQVPNDVLVDFKGCVQTDGYAGYNEIAKRDGIVHICCMAHARRKFDEALQNDREKASHALTVFQQLYAIEREAYEDQLSDENRTKLRQQKSKPILKAFKKWMEETYPIVLPKSAIGKAITYTLNQWTELNRYTENGAWSIDNNAVENKIRPLALGRKNYLFAGSHNAAQQAAMMYSFFGTCKLNDIEPFEWLKQTLTKIPETKLSELNNLLPIKKQNA